MIWTAVLMLFGASFGTAMISGSGGPLPLDIAPNSVDDMYQGCADHMQSKVNAEFLKRERNKKQNFKLAWIEAEQYYNSLLKKYPKPPLPKEQIMAIYAYTLEVPKLYFEFNNTVRAQKCDYTTTFAYHTLHFFLTRALQTLNLRNPSAKRCLYSYRRVNRKFSTDVLNKEIRFGAFTSSSVGSYPSSAFGDQSCFEIYTCFSADISKYSKFGKEREALIPPYEVFKVIQIEKRSPRKKLPCEVVYKVRSTKRTLSNTNCAGSKDKNTSKNLFGACFG